MQMSNHTRVFLVCRAVVLIAYANKNKLQYNARLRGCESHNY